MRDKEKGWVEIELKGKQEGDRNIVIRRDLERASNRSSYKLAGEVATQALIHQKVQEMGIQVNNLCTFLPQDKVGKFTEMDPQKLLMETEKVVCAGVFDLFTTHEDLIARQRYVFLPSGREGWDGRLLLSSGREGWDGRLLLMCLVSVCSLSLLFVSSTHLLSLPPSFPILPPLKQRPQNLRHRERNLRTRAQKAAGTHPYFSYSFLTSLSFTHHLFLPPSLPIKKQRPQNLRHRKRNLRKGAQKAAGTSGGP